MRNIAWWWWFRFLVSLGAIVLYNGLFHPHGFWAFWGGGVAVGIGTIVSLEACRAGYRMELRDKRQRKGLE
jgi:hypothetical protein